MNATDIYKAPFTTDGAYIYGDGGVMALMAGDCANYPEKMCERVCQILNGTNPTVGNPGVGADGPSIYLNGDLILEVRGWGHLTGAGGLNLPEEEAVRIQDEFALFVVSKLRGEG